MIYSLVSLDIVKCSPEYRTSVRLDEGCGLFAGAAGQ
jgi:hypothetical protein